MPVRPPSTAPSQAPSLLDLAGPGEPAAQDRDGEDDGHDGQQRELGDGQRDAVAPREELLDAAGQRHEEHREDRVDVQRAEDPTLGRRRLAQALGEDDRGHRHHRGAHRGLHPEAGAGEVVAVGDLQRVERTEQVQRRLQDEADGVAGQHRGAAHVSAQPPRRERVQQVHDDGQGDGGADQPSGDERGDAGVGQPGDEPRHAAGDHDRAGAVAGPPPPCEQPGSRVDGADEREQQQGPGRRHRPGDEQGDLDAAQQQQRPGQGDERERQRARDGARSRRRCHAGRGLDEHHASVGRS
ncbi:MAG: hypothetical protein R2736_20500 [Solirubrobacterales bacterium]